MFDNLLGGRFSNKCKHAVKCVNARMVPIRNKKQAMLRFLRKDVADLLKHGHDSNALGRIDSLIVEINQMSCYDMIEQYCTLILKELPVLQKRRECPQETMDAVSTLIFAAARFPDLPELCDLRRAFTERYGDQMEPFVNAEFVEKIQKKSFSEEEKINLMQDISEEYSINWNSEKLGNKLSKSSLSFDDRKKSSPVSNGNQRTIELQNGKHGMTVDIPREEKSANGNTPRKESPWRPQIKPNGINGISRIKNEDGNVIDSPMKTEKLFTDEAEIMEPRCKDIALSPTSMKARDWHTRTNEDDANVNKPLRESPWRPQIKPKGVNGDGNMHDSPMKAEKLFTNESENREPRYLKDPSTHNDRRNSKYTGTVDEGFSNGQVSHTDGNIESPSKKSIQLLNDRSSYRVPPYTKSKETVSFSYKEEKQDDLISYNISKAEEVHDSICQDAWQSRNVNQQNNRSPVIPSNIKPKVTNFPELNGVAKQVVLPNPSSLPTAGCGVPNGRKDNSIPQRLCDEEKSKPRSVRKKHSKFLTKDDEEKFLNESPKCRGPGDKNSTEASLHDANSELRTVGHKSRILAEDEEDNAIEYGKLLIRTPSGQRRHQVNKVNDGAYDADCDQEQKIMDKLLIHYSKKVLHNKKPLIRAVPANQLITDGDVSSVQRGKKKHMESTETFHLRAASLPPEPNCSVDAPRPTRATSMEPDLLSPCMERVHPNLPDYDELAARLNSLRKTKAV